MSSTSRLPAVRAGVTVALLVPGLLVATATPSAAALQSADATTAAPADTIGPPPPRQLGEVDFPTSAGPEAQAWFERGVLLLHSFIYDDAADAFRKARALEPDFALAHWGEAMTHNHPLWRQQDSAAARAVLDRLAPTPGARRARAPTEREKLYLDAAEALYGEGSKARRDTLYSRALEALVERYPEDREAAAFHALSLLGLSGGDRHVPTYMRGGAEALRLMHDHPEHPGAMHYAIHAFDDPTHAPLGLEAARRYGHVAPGAHHARHMTSHIFLALGLWDDVVAANEAAAGAVAEERGGGSGDLHPCGHYAEWLAYGYLQQARPGAARELVGRCLALSREGGGEWWSVARMRTILLADDPSTPDAIADAAPAEHDVGPSGRSFALLGDGLAALQRDDPAAAREALASLGALASEEAGEAWHRVRAGVLEAAVLRAGGDLEAALRAARGAAELAAEQPVPFGPPSSFKPPRELEGEILLALERPDEARAAFRRALERTPRRARSLLGLARAAEAAGAGAEARAAYGELTAIWSEAEGTWPAVAEVRQRPDAASR